MNLETNAMPVFENNNLTMRVVAKMCRSKKKRIVKKWLASEAHYKTVADDSHVYIMNGAIVGHHKAIQKLLEVSKVVVGR